ncbi:TPA: hypothetical protein K4452_002908 [Enterococcus faecalis]|uniref:hypothetical protein n=1 Tax=Enterococcus faecalis TaxID=1351 RepID=UPI001CB378C7|nr:hypothetical protein [Enterococcus faecalis]MDU6706084.1 hypothetical protein [Enterococcus faecalis]HBI3769491.1 hypothetical protein [Enterococcus faecalis]HDT7284803.1 hypothetical protein [Enterococcus faecalis]
MGVVYAIIIVVPSIFCTCLFILHNRLNHIECKMSNLSERQIRIMRCIQPTPDGWKVTGKMKREKSTYQDSKTGAILPTRQQAISPQMKTKTKSVLSEHETEMVKEVVLEKIDVLKNNLQFMQSNQRKHNGVYTLKQFERQLTLYERIYQKMSDDEE